jgi:hypothetical protein
MKISFKDDVLPITGVGSMLGIVLCLISFAWIDSEIIAKIISKLGITFGIIALISLMLTNTKGLFQKRSPKRILIRRSIFTILFNNFNQGNPKSLNQK